MNRNYAIRLTITVAALSLLVFLAWTFLEVQPRRVRNPPAREARVNEYLALDRWLTALGYPVRVVSTGNYFTILDAEERRIFIQASLFSWQEGIDVIFTEWIEEGGTLFLALDYQQEEDFLNFPPLLLLLEEFGITARTDQGRSLFFLYPELPLFAGRFSFEVSDETSPNAAEGNVAEGNAAEGGDDDNGYVANNDNNSNDNGNYYNGGNDDGGNDDGGNDRSKITIVEDENGHARLVRVNRGYGNFIVSGRPEFLLSENLNHEPDARLAWMLFAEPETRGTEQSENGWLFIRGRARSTGLLGTLFQHGNMAALTVAALVLLVVGFWAVIPMFGLLRRDDPPPGKPLRERFAAEGRFLKRYGALNFYCDTYIKEIRRRLARKEGIASNEEIISRGLVILGKSGGQSESQLFASAVRQEPIPYRDFPKMVSIFKTILERI